MGFKLLGEKKRQQRDQILIPVIEYLSRSARRDLTDKEIKALQMHYEQKPILEALTTLFKDKVGSTLDEYNEENQVTLEDVLPEAAKIITESDVYGNDCPNGQCDI